MHSYGTRWSIRVYFKIVRNRILELYFVLCWTWRIVWCSWRRFITHVLQIVHIERNYILSDVYLLNKEVRIETTEMKISTKGVMHERQAKRALISSNARTVTFFYTCGAMDVEINVVLASIPILSFPLYPSSLHHHHSHSPQAFGVSLAAA